MMRGWKAALAACILLYSCFASRGALARGGHAEGPVKENSGKNDPGDAKAREEKAFYDALRSRFTGISAERTPSVVRNIFVGSRNRYVNNLKTFDREYRELLALYEKLGKTNYFPDPKLAASLAKLRLRYEFDKDWQENKRFDYLSKKNWPALKELQDSEVIEFQEMLTTQSVNDHRDVLVSYGIEAIRAAKAYAQEKIDGKVPKIDFTTQKGASELRYEALKNFQANYPKGTQFSMYVSKHNGNHMLDLVRAANALPNLDQVYRIVLGQYPGETVTPVSNLLRLNDMREAFDGLNHQVPAASYNQWAIDDEIRRRME